MVKKVVDVYNRAFEINTADDVSVDRYSLTHLLTHSPNHLLTHSETNDKSDVEVSDTIHEDDVDDAGTSAVYTPARVKPSKEKSTVTATTGTHSLT